MTKIKHAPHLSEAGNARNLMRWATKAYLATELKPNLKEANAPGGHVEGIEENYPYASLSLVCLDHDATCKGLKSSGLGLEIIGNLDPN
ncbi:hypothetical protein [Kiloniella sp.]|uniref:hypothetical protein n=1 Tax=Kiloniella sp. TaxID=1938587 RepID=UPI003B02B7D1